MWTIKDLEKLQKLGKIKSIGSFKAAETATGIQDPEKKMIQATQSAADKTKRMLFLQLQAIAEGHHLNLVTEYVFHPSRKFRADFALLSHDRTIKILIEYEGITSFNGHHNGHTNINGYSNDCMKYNLAQLCGYEVFRFTSKTHETMFDIITEYLNHQQ